MTELNLQNQLLDQTRELKDNISRLEPSDPMRDWFTIELRHIGFHDTSSDISLDEANARLSAMKQLRHLVWKHVVQIKNPGMDRSAEERIDSFLTIEQRLPAEVLATARQQRFSIEPSLLHNPLSNNDQFDPVSPTAKVVGYLRSLDDSLQLSAELSMESEGQQILQDLGITNAETQSLMAVLFQSRYHAINAIIGQNATAQIIELAAGISPRGIQWSRTTPGTIYIESDLPQLMIHKAKLVRNCLRNETKLSRGLLHCCAVDVLDRNSLQETLKSLDPTQPFTLVTEGLLLYFSETEMKQFWENIASILGAFPNASWVADLVTQHDLQQMFTDHADVARGVREIFSQTGRTVVPSNPFQTPECIPNWLDNYSLKADATLALSEATHLVKPPFELSAEQRRSIVGERKIFRMVTK